MSTELETEVYTLRIEVPFRPVSTTLRATNDAQAVTKAAALLWATCSAIDGLGDYDARLMRSDGTDVMVPVSVAVLAAKA